MDEVQIPATLEEALSELQRMLHPKDLEAIRRLKEDELFTMHNDLGMAIRNSWLYPGAPQLMEDIGATELDSADDVSDHICWQLWNRLNGRPPEEFFGREEGEPEIVIYDVSHFLDKEDKRPWWSRIFRR